MGVDDASFIASASCKTTFAAIITIGAWVSIHNLVVRASSCVRKGNKAKKASNHESELHDKLCRNRK